MKERFQIGLLILCFMDVVTGLFMSLWPGSWHELTHPFAVRTTFYLIQQVGLILIARGILTAILARRADGFSFRIVGILWALEVPAHGYAVITLGAWSHYGTSIAFGRLFMCLFVLVWCRRRAASLLELNV